MPSKEVREIKFRAWDIPGKRMLDVTEITFGKLIIGKWYKSPTRQGHYTMLADECILMQFTGLLDKNGKEIYEGDIVKAFCNINEIADPELAKGVEPKYDYKEVRCRKGAFVLSTKKYNYCGTLGYGTSTMPETLEVVGNIHENPELLEQNNDQ